MHGIIHKWAKGIIIILLMGALAACSKDSDSEPSLPPIMAELMEGVNEVRSQGGNCGGQWQSPSQPLQWDDKLGRAAKLHAEDMAEGNYLSHFAADGRSPGQRITAQGYAWQTHGENIAKGFQSAPAVLQAWLSSEGHCKNIMSKNFTQIGMGYDPRGHYWVQVFARPVQSGQQNNP